MQKKLRYTPEHAQSGLDAKFPEIETWPNQFPGYEIVIEDPEFTSVCPKTGLPDFGEITIRYMPDKQCLELKSLKEYLHSYRNLGIFQENILNRVLEDVARWAKPVWAEVKGDFRPRGGISTVVIARWPRQKKKVVANGPAVFSHASVFHKALSDLSVLHSFRHGGKRLLQIGDQVVHVFDSYRQPDHLLGHAHLAPMLRRN